MTFLLILKKTFGNHCVHRADDLHILKFQPEEKVKEVLREQGYRFGVSAGCYCFLSDHEP